MSEEVDLLEWIDTADRHSAALLVIMSVSIVEDWVTAAIKTQTRRGLSSKLEERLFSGYGPLSTFSAKIDVGYAFNLFEQETYNDLRALKDIRNAFAHTRDFVHFQSPELAPLFQKLTGWTKEAHPHTLFKDRVAACVEALKLPLRNKVMLEELIRQYDVERGLRSLLGKSE